MSVLDSFLDDLVDIYTKFKTSEKLPELFITAKNQLDQAIEQALQAEDFDQVFNSFKAAFKSTQDHAARLFPQLWNGILERNILKGEDLAKFLYELADELNPEPFQTLLETLLKNKTNLLEIMPKIASFCLSVPADMKQRLSKIWGPLLAVMLKFSGPQKIASVLSRIMTSDEKIFAQPSNLIALNLFESTSNSQILEKMLCLPDFQMPSSVILSGLGLQYLVQKANIAKEMEVPDCSSQTVRGLFSPILETIKEASFKSPVQLDNLSVVRLFMELIRQAKENEEMEWQLMKMARFAPVGILLIIAAILYCAITHPLPWWNLLFNEIEKDPDLKIKRLPAPSKDGPKYLIFSDIHRDAKSDKREPLEFGSIDHFSSNQRLYCELLDFAIKNGFTVIEAGDCDELWYFRDFTRRPKEKLKEIIATHRPVYNRLAKLHRLGRYVRLYGNHDAAVRKPEIFSVLQKIFDRNRKPDQEPFQIYDFAVIEDVKSMDESILNFGLDADPYKTKMPMIVAHGHQWDFWNCDANNIIGKLIVSAIVTPIDFLDDPFVDAGGIAYSGSPVVNFSTMLSKAFVLCSFPAQLAARKFAHHIQHLDEHKRYTVDDIYFLETLAALSGATIGVRKRPDSEEISRKNLLCLGHTHFPQSQPYYNLKKLIPFLGPWLHKLESNVIEKTHGLIKPDLSLIKSRYFNSGTAGWMEGVIWAIQIDETAQARLVYWTRDSRPDRPQTMDWELPLMDEQLRAKLEKKKGRLLNCIEDLSCLIDPLIDSAVSSIIRALAAPFEELIDLFGRSPAANIQMDSSESLAGPLCYVFLSLLGAEETRTHTFKVTIPDSTRERISKVQELLVQFPELNLNDRMRLACAWILASQCIPCLGTSKNRFEAEDQRLPGSSPFMQSMLGLVLMLPGEQNEFAPIKSRVTLKGNELVIHIITRPLMIRQPRVVPRDIPLNDDIGEQQIRYPWTNVIRLPDSML